MSATLVSPLEALRCQVPPMAHDGVVVEQFEVGTIVDDLEACVIALQGRGTRPGRYTRLVVDDVLWMSDTDAERRDHLEPVMAARAAAGGNGLVNGLGLGLVVHAMLDHLAHVDVVEQNERVIASVGEWYRAKFGDRITIHHADAYDITWPTGTRWDVAWHDIWPTLTVDDLDRHAKLSRRYGRRVGWQGCWGHTLLLREARRWGR